MKAAHVAKHKVVVMGVNRLEGMRGARPDHSSCWII